ncbi:terminase [Chryseobacterium viscerum]|uniref:Terminase n=1 Tax=Chryseobacterium viscerum TaxID=1037377 RepID=A0A5N4BJ39_9FLAO|nr:terminase [Chryseobacterium viscerum]KAB1228461.1 terminase [Chryseobacterium viscerum]
MSEENKGGRPSLYDPFYHPKKVLGYCLLGLTNEQIAGVFDIAVSTLYEWQKEYPEFSEAIKSGKEEADVKIAASLYKRALGGKEKVKKAFKLRETINGVGSKERIEIHEEEILIPADTGAAIFWLKNRHPDQWRDKKELDVNDPSKITGVTLVDDDEESDSSE